MGLAYRFRDSVHYYPGGKHGNVLAGLALVFFILFLREPEDWNPQAVRRKVSTPTVTHFIK